MRATLLVLALLAVPVVAADQVPDEIGDVLATHQVSSMALAGSPYADCTHDAADIVGLTATSAAGIFAVQLLVADREAQPDCPLPVPATTDIRAFILDLARVGGTSAVSSMHATWTETNGAPSGAARLRFASDSRSGTCDGGGLAAVGDAITFSCPLQGTATLPSGAKRAYDIRDTTWDVTGMTRHDHGTPATFVHFVDVLGPTPLGT